MREDSPTTNDAKQDSSSLDTASRLTFQPVLAETITQSAQESWDLIPKKIVKELETVTFWSIEVRDDPILPDFNIIFPEESANQEELSKQGEFFKKVIIQRIRKIFEFLPLDRKNIRPGTIVIDPTKTPYIDSLALFHSRSSRIWIKRNSLLSLDHEAAHWLTNFSTHTKSLHRNHLLLEGLAAWIAHNVKSEEELHERDKEDYRFMIDFVWKHVFTQEEVSLQMNFQNITEMYFGAALWEVLSETIGDKEILMNHWSRVDEYNSVSEWIESMDLNPAEVESEWKRKIFQRETV